MLCLPGGRVVVENVAPPFARFAVPPAIAVPLSRNVTVPVGVPLVGEVTPAVKVTFCW
jgi:hypothetical protein